MTYAGGEFSTEDLFAELKIAVDGEGIKDFDQYKDLVDQAVEEKRSYGFFSEDEDLTQLKESLLARWPETQG